MNDLETRLKKYFSQLTNSMLTVCMLLGLGMAGVQAQTPDMIPGQFYFKIGDEITNETTLEPGDTITLIVGFSSAGIVDGVTSTFDWDPSLASIVPGVPTDLIGAPLNFSLGYVTDNEVGHFTWSKAYINFSLDPNLHPVLPDLDAAGVAIDTPHDLFSIEIAIASDIEFNTSVTFENQGPGTYALSSALVYHGLDLIYGNAIDEMPDFTINIDAGEVGAPANDEACAAIELMCGDELTGTLEGATVSNFGVPECSDSDGSMADVFYQFDANPGEIYTVVAGASPAAGLPINGVLSFYTNGCSDIADPTLIGVWIWTVQVLNR